MVFSLISIKEKNAVGRGVCVVLLHLQLCLHRGLERAALIRRTCQESEILRKGWKKRVREVKFWGKGGGNMSGKWNFGELAEISIIICCWEKDIKRCKWELRLLCWSSEPLSEESAERQTSISRFLERNPEIWVSGNMLFSHETWHPFPSFRQLHVEGLGHGRALTELLLCQFWPTYKAS